MSQSKLFRPLQLGDVRLNHRIVMAPLTRFRAESNHVPTASARVYYEQRASTPGTLIITEATFISPCAAGYRNAPGIWNDEQIKAWKEITDAVHAEQSFIYLQLWALGRTADPEVLKQEGEYRVVSSSPIPISAEQHTVGVDTGPPSELKIDEIALFVEDYAQAARNAIKAGFDGVEIHGANGYLIDQFWQDVANHRTDGFGGSISNRARFGLEVTAAVIKAVGDSRKVGMRLSPWGKGQGMGMDDPIPQFLHITKALKELNLAYLHFIESRISGTNAANAVYSDEPNHQNDVFVDAWGRARPVLLAGGFTPEKAERVANEVHVDENVCIVFGRYFISNPDLPFRIQKTLELSKWERLSFYTGAKTGYTDYAFSKEWLAAPAGSIQ